VTRTFTLSSSLLPLQLLLVVVLLLVRSAS
jgi:hypothetical protein